MNTTRRLLFLATIPSLISSACGARPPQAAAPVTESAPAALRVDTAVVTGGSEAAVQTPASIRARQRAFVSSRIPALVVSMPFREGDTVREGEVLVRLDDAPQRAAVTAAEAQRLAAESESRRVTNLLAKGAATARESEAVQARLEGARAALASATDLLATTSIRAPFSGHIVSKSVNPGDLANPGAPLLELQGGSALELVATLEPSDAASVRIGQKLAVHVDGVPSSIEATVYSIAPAANENTHRLDVLCNLGADPHLKPGLFARVELPSAKKGSPGSLSIPGGAVLRRGGLTGVFVVKDHRAWLRWIAIGRETGDRVEVRAGLAEGERVVIAPSGLTDGVSVIESVQ